MRHNSFTTLKIVHSSYNHGHFSVTAYNLIRMPFQTFITYLAIYFLFISTSSRKIILEVTRTVTCINEIKIGNRCITSYIKVIQQHHLYFKSGITKLGSLEEILEHSCLILGSGSSNGSNKSL